MKITLSQLNVMVGDILSNKSKNIDYIDEAADSGADPALPGEMVLSAVGRCRWPMMYTEIKNHLNNKYYVNT